MIKYDKKIARVLLTEQEANDLTIKYSLDEALFFPYISDDIRVYKEMQEEAIFKDMLIKDILDALNLNSYYGTY